MSPNLNSHPWRFSLSVKKPTTFSFVPLSLSLEPVGRCPTPQLCNQQCDLNICKRSGKLCCCRGCEIGCTTPVWSLDVRMYIECIIS
jgi:hypothetical protein